MEMSCTLRTTRRFEPTGACELVSGDAGSVGEMSCTVRSAPRLGAASAGEAVMKLTQRAMIEAEYRTEDP